MYIPVSTYRIQLTPDFGLDAVRQIIPYLEKLGISDIYASPILKARQGSTHGYDVVDWNQLNPELGSREKYDALRDDLQDRGMGWIQDIVPNHMAYDSQNQYLMDVLERGPNSEFVNYFDIEWEHPYEDIKGKVLVPLLGDFYGNCLEKGQIQLKYERERLAVSYYDLQIPLRIESYARLVTYDLNELSHALGKDHPDFIKLMGILYILQNISEGESGEQRNEQLLFGKGLLWELYEANTEVQKFIDRNLKTFNGTPGEPESFNLLDELLAKQFFRLSFWKVGAEELNYRRFFTINDLVCLRIEDREVCEQTHKLILQLVREDYFQGLRIDHIDGLYDPTDYLIWLREQIGDRYLIVEKILELERDFFSRYEELPQEWPVQGTSGYDFLNVVNQVFCQKDNVRHFDEIYSDFTGLSELYDTLCVQKKRLIVDTNLAGDLENLANLLKKFSGLYRYGRDFTLNGLRKAIQEVLVLFPVYRTYISSGTEVRERDRNYIEEVIRRAKQNIPQLLNELSLIEKVLLLQFDGWLTDEEKAQWLRFVMCFQQVTGPLTAKGIEDTLLYVYNRLISLNEVGGIPAQFGITTASFHNFNRMQQDHWPHSLNTTSTHDTKRSEDVRARVNVLSEIPDRWSDRVNYWKQLNRARKLITDRREVPDANDEYFLYQTLVGAFPLNDRDRTQFTERIKQYSIKAVREAKVHTAWLQPDTEYEEGYLNFIDRLLQPADENGFSSAFLPFQQSVAYYGMYNSLSQTLLKIASPGIPDFYQGTELWDFSLADPDNRRPVDFEYRLHLLEELDRQSSEDLSGLLKVLLSSWTDGRIKLFAIARSLRARQEYADVFQHGTYVPLEVVGSLSDCAIAFAWHYGDTVALVVVPRFLTQFIKPGEYPLGSAVWRDTHLAIPAELELQWTNVFTDRVLQSREAIGIGEILELFPVALLIGRYEK
ncbi:malto-oligosyltrehalose synthase [Synechococcus sp. PCC 7336]|uniref:malto-oligosyltrehalose synthase n=1 Tax=Synechococcus sp. PCC 7336 TaxID=195250 RepID=UPI00034894AA|nr:malto-oligosyltrehalose synthase [Synechococcus sp. PCC 7336]